MSNSEVIRQAVFNMGGTKMVGEDLQVSPSTVGKWIRNGVIPNLDNARKVAKASGFEVSVLRPGFQSVISNNAAESDEQQAKEFLQEFLSAVRQDITIDQKEFDEICPLRKFARCNEMTFEQAITEVLKIRSKCLK